MTTWSFDGFAGGNDLSVDIPEFSRVSGNSGSIQANSNGNLWFKTVSPEAYYIVSDAAIAGKDKRFSVTWNSTSGMNSAMILRYVDTNNWTGFRRSSSNILSIQRKLAGTLTDISAVTTASVGGVGVGDVLSCEVVGDDYKFYKNDVLIPALNTTVSDFNTAIGFGFVARSDGRNDIISSATVENLSNVINSTNSGANDLNAGAVNTASITGYVVGVNPVVSGTVGSLALTSVSQDGGIVSATIPAPVNDSYWPEPDVSHLLTFTDGSTPATFDAVMNSLEGYTSIVLASPDNSTPYKIGANLTTPAANDDRIMYKTADMTVGADTSISDATIGATTIYYHWIVADSKIYEYSATLTAEGVSAPTGGLTAAGLTAAGLTAVGL